MAPALASSGLYGWAVDGTLAGTGGERADCSFSSSASAKRKGSGWWCGVVFGSRHGDGAGAMMSTGDDRNRCTARWGPTRRQQLRMDAALWTAGDGFRQL